MKDEILIEVQEQIAEERRRYFFKKYGTLLGYFALGIILVFGGYEAWKSYDKNTRELMGDNLIAKINQRSPEMKIDEFSGQQGFAQLAKLAKADALAVDDKNEEAIATYKAVWENKSYDEAIRKIAKIKAAILMINSKDAETPIWFNTTEEGVFDDQFNELVAIHSLQNSNDEKAEKIFENLQENEQTAATVKNRVNAYLSETTNN
jgi:hypothetical protein